MSAKYKLGDVVSIVRGPAGHYERPDQRNIGRAATVIALDQVFGHWRYEVEGWDETRAVEFRDTMDEVCLEKLL